MEVKVTNNAQAVVEESSKPLVTLKVKKCKCCGEVKPLNHFTMWRNIKPMEICADCVAKKKSETHAKKSFEKKEEVLRTELSQFEPRELIAELRRRGYSGELVVKQTIRV